MLETETQPDLHLEKEQALTAKWGIRRIIAERDLQLCNNDPTMPVLFKQALDTEINYLDNMIPRMPERARIFGEAAEVAAWLSLRTLESIIHDIQTGVKPVLDPGGANVK